MLKKSAVTSFKTKEQNKWGYIFILPWIIGFFSFTFIPLFYSLFVSFTDWNMFEMNFVGWQNYKEVLQSSTFHIALSNTLIYTFFTAIINIVVGLIIAWSLSGKSVFNTALRTIIYLPSLIIGLAFAMMMTPIFGGGDYTLINQLRSILGMEPQEWLTTRGQGVIVMILMSFWGIGGAMVVFIAGFKMIDPVLYDAAEIDGASRNKIFLKICIPVLIPVIIYQTIMSLIFGMQVFDIAIGLAQVGGAATSLGMGIDGSLATLVYYLYNTGFKDFEMGKASAIGWVIFLLTSIIGIFMLVFIKKTKYYTSD